LSSQLQQRTPVQHRMSLLLLRFQMKLLPLLVLLLLRLLLFLLVLDLPLLLHLLNLPLLLLRQPRAACGIIADYFYGFIFRTA